MIAELVREHQPLVRTIACRVMQEFRLPASAEQVDDLLSFGDGGLFEAARRFDPQRGVQFSTFAGYRIRGAMLDGLRALRWYPRRQKDGRPAEPIYLTKLDAAAMVADRRPTPEEIAIQAQAFRQLREAVAALGKVERRLIIGYFFEGKTLEEAGREIGGLSKSWTCRLLARTLDRLRAAMVGA